MSGGGSEEDDAERTSRLSKSLASKFSKPFGGKQHNPAAAAQVRLCRAAWPCKSAD